MANFALLWAACESTTVFMLLYSLSRVLLPDWLAACLPTNYCYPIPPFCMYYPASKVEAQIIFNSYLGGAEKFSLLVSSLCSRWNSCLVRINLTYWIELTSCGHFYTHRDYAYLFRVLFVVICVVFVVSTSLDEKKQQQQKGRKDKQRLRTTGDHLHH